MKRRFSNWLIMILSLVAVTGFVFSPVLADEMDFAKGLSSGQQEEVIAPDEDLQNDFSTQEESFGLGYQYTWVPATSFLRYYNDGEFTFGGFYGWVTTKNLVVANIRLPNGAYLAQARLYYYDNSADDIQFGVTQERVYTGVESWCWQYPKGTPGYTYVDCNPTLTIHNQNGFYHLHVYFPVAGGSNLRFLGVRLLWRRQVAPAPASPSFSDVAPDAWYYNSVEQLYAAGITSGCGGGKFCPDMLVDRKQIARFLTTALGLHWPY